MKVLFLCRRPFETIVGGVAEYLHYLPRALKTYGVESISYTAGKKKLTGPYFLANGMPAYRGPYLKPGLFSFARKLKPLFDFCQREKISVVHAQGIYRSGYVAMQIQKHTGIPFIVTSHSDILTTNSERMRRDKIQSRCHTILQHANAVTHLTPLMADACNQVFDTRKKSYIIGNGTDFAEWQTYHAIPEKKFMLCIGRLEPGKGFNIIINAYAELRRQGIKTSLMIAGDGTAKFDLQNQVKELGLNLVTDFQDFENVPEESVIFPGYIKGEAKKRLFAHSQLILFSTQPNTWEEAFSIVQMEAMSAGKAMIASDTAPTRYLQSLGLQTILVKPDDVQAWADKMKFVLENADVRQKMCQTNLENVKKFDWSVIAKQYHEVYSALV